MNTNTECSTEQFVQIALHVIANHFTDVERASANHDHYRKLHGCDSYTCRPISVEAILREFGQEDSLLTDSDRKLFKNWIAHCIINHRFHHDSFKNGIWDEKNRTYRQADDLLMLIAA